MAFLFTEVVDEDEEGLAVVEWEEAVEEDLVVIGVLIGALTGLQEEVGAAAGLVAAVVVVIEDSEEEEMVDLEAEMADLVEAVALEIKGDTVEHLVVHSQKLKSAFLKMWVVEYTSITVIFATKNIFYEVR